MYFDAGQILGVGATESPDYPTAQALLAQLDRLGVARAVVSHAAARSCHAGWANDRLLEDLTATPAASGRLIPALCISPNLLYEPGALLHFCDTFAAVGSRALCYPQLRGNWTLSQVSPVLEELAPQRPVLFLDLHADGFTTADLLACTESFPQVSVVISGVMWPFLVTLLELMQQRENVLASTAWMHTYGDLELVAERFGAERLVLGIGPRAHAGAGLLRLRDARLSEADREAVAHGNLERLLGLEPLPADPVPAAAPLASQLWRRPLAGEPLEVDVVDAHGHLGPIGAYLLRSPDPAEHVREMLASMDRLGLDLTLVSGGQALFSDPVEGNWALERLLRPHGERLRAYLAFNPHHSEALASHLEEYFTSPVFVGFKILCDYWRVPLTDPRLEPAWDYAHEHRLPILVHTWSGGYNAPALLAEIAPAHPDAAFLLAHSGGPDREGALQLAEHNPNVYLEWCGSFVTGEDWHAALDRVGPERLVFGTDGIAHDEAWELGRLLSQGFADDILEMVLGRNMRALLARRL